MIQRMLRAKIVDLPSGEGTGDLFFGSNKRIRYGTSASPTTITKTLQIPFSALVPQDDTVDWDLSNQDLRPNSTGLHVYYVSIPLPDGVTISAFRFRGYSNDLNDLCRLILQRIDSSGGSLTQLGSADASDGGGWQTVEDTSVNETVSGTSYQFRLELGPDGAAGDTRFAWAEIDYEVSNLSQAI